MSNAYHIGTGKAAIRQFTRATRGLVDGSKWTGRHVLAHELAPVVRNSADGWRTLELMRWGLPSRPADGTRVTTNIHHLGDPFWSRGAAPAYRCLVPATSFCLHGHAHHHTRVPYWIALDQTRPVFAFAGIWREIAGPWGSREGPLYGRHLLFAIVACIPNAFARSIGARRMPLLLTTPEACTTWLEGSLSDALAMQIAMFPHTLHVLSVGNTWDKVGEDGQGNARRTLERS